MRKEAQTDDRIEESILKKNLSQIDQASVLIRSVHNPVRQKVLSLLLSRGTQAVHDLCKKTQLEQSVVSQHLGVLRKVKLVTTQKEGRYVFYSINEARLNEVIEFIQQIVAR